MFDQGNPQPEVLALDPLQREAEQVIEILQEQQRINPNPPQREAEQVIEISQEQQRIDPNQSQQIQQLATEH